MQIDVTPSQRTSLGVEWEPGLADLDTRQLTSGSDEILTASSPNGDAEHPKARHEPPQSCIEVITGICQTVAEARAGLAGTVTEVSKAAAERTLGIIWVEDLLPVARRLDCSDELETIPRWIRRGARYQRQRAAAAANHGDLTAVVDLLLDEMRDGLPL